MLIFLSIESSLMPVLHSRICSALSVFVLLVNKQKNKIRTSLRENGFFPVNESSRPPMNVPQYTLLLSSMPFVYSAIVNRNHLIESFTRHMLMDGLLWTLPFLISFIDFWHRMSTANIDNELKGLFSAKYKYKGA